MNLIRYFKSLFIKQCHHTIKAGDHFEVTQKVKRTAIYDIQGPMTDGFKCEIQAGSIMSCKREPADNDILFYLWPENPESIERDYVPEEIRSSSNYLGFAIYWYLADLKDVLRKL